MWWISWAVQLQNLKHAQAKKNLVKNNGGYQKFEHSMWHNYSQIIKRLIWHTHTQTNIQKTCSLISRNYHYTVCYVHAYKRTQLNNIRCTGNISKCTNGRPKAKHSTLGTGEYNECYLSSATPLSSKILVQMSWHARLSKKTRYAAM